MTLNKLEIIPEDYSEIQLDVLEYLYNKYGKSIAQDVADCQIESGMMELAGECIGKKLITKDEIEEFIGNNIKPCTMIYECCETQESYDILYNFLENLLYKKEN